MEINNKTVQNRERLNDAVLYRNNAKQTKRPLSHNHQKNGNGGNGVNGTSLLNKLLNLANDKFVTKSAGNTPCSSPIQPFAMSPENLSPRPLAKSDVCLPRRELPPRDMTKSCDAVSIRAKRRVSSPTHEKRLNVTLQQQQQQRVPHAQRILLPKCSRKVLRPTSSRYLLARIDCNRHENDIDSDSTTMTVTSEESDESLSEEEGSRLTFCIDDTQLQFLKEKLQAYEEDYTTTTSDDDEKEEVGCEFKNATPSNRNKKRSEIVLSPSARILQAGFATYKRYPNGIVNFVRTDIHVANWRFCYVCALDSPNTRYIRQLTLTDVIHNYAGFAECQIFRIVKFCASCFQRYNENAAKRPDHPLRVKMTTYATNLFCAL
jgi:dUTPase